MEAMMESGGGDGGGMRPAKGRPPQEQLNCPRCKSGNTKFCYYNNYSLTQPRYFCKSCRRYWTEGGSLRNIPVGGGSRKNRKSVASVVGGSGSAAHHAPPPAVVYQGHDLNLGFGTAAAGTTAVGMENGGQGGFGCYIPNLMPYSARDTAVEENSGANNGYWNGMFGGGAW